MAKIFNTRIQNKRDTAANWESRNPVLLNGEMVLVDTSAGELRIKIGDGVKTYTQLPFTDEKVRTLITEKQNKTDNNLQTTSKDIVGAINEVKDNFTSHNHDDKYDEKGSADKALATANLYTDGKIDALIGEGASTTLDTIGEISKAIEDHKDVTDALNAAIGNKANASDLTSHTQNKSNPHGVTLSQLGVTLTLEQLNGLLERIATLETQVSALSAKLEKAVFLEDVSK